MRAAARVAFVALLRAGAAAASAPPAVTVAVAVADGAGAAVQELDDLYLGYNIDSGSLYQGIQLDNALLGALSRNLAPAQLRVGGSASDSVWYCPDAPDGDTQGPSPDPLAPNAAAMAAPGYTGYVPQATIMNSALWRSVTAYTAAAGLNLLWDVNAVDFRTAAGAWDPSANASALLAFTSAQNLLVSAWELGNEPDIWNKHFNLVVSGTQLAADLRTLQKTLASYPGLSTAVSGPSLATFNAPIVQSFLQGWAASGGGELAFTAHAYPLGPPTYTGNSTRPSCSVANYLNLTRVSNLATYLAEFTAAVAQYGDSSSTRMVLEETASSSLGGCIGYSDRFISGFYFTNLLGIVGEAGWQQVNRQDLAGMSFTAAGSQYTLFGPPGWTNGSGLISETSPHADYFTAILWRRLMGKVVLTNAVSGDAAGAFAAHVWCAADTAPDARPGAVTVAYMNAYNTSASITLAGADGAAYSLSPRREFFLTADDNNLTDYSVYLNLAANPDALQRAAARLRVRADGSLPKDVDTPTGRLVHGGATLVVPPLSYGYIVLPNARAPACSGSSSPTATARFPHWLVHIANAVALVSVVAVSVLAYIAIKARFAAGKPTEGGSWDARLLVTEPSKRGYGALL